MEINTFTTLVFILFILYSTLQFIVINKWTIDYEQKQINRQVTEIAAYYQDKSDTLSIKTFENSKDFLNNMIDKHQMIRVIGMDGKPIVTVSRDFNETWIKPKQVLQDELFIKDM